MGGPIEMLHRTASRHRVIQLDQAEFLEDVNVVAELGHLFTKLLTYFFWTGVLSVRIARASARSGMDRACINL